MAGASRGVAFRTLVGAVLIAATGCSETVSGTGSLGAGAIVPAGSTRPPGTATPAAKSTSTPTPEPTPTQRKRDPAAVAAAVDLRATDLPAGWRQIPSSGDETNDSFNWVIVCARDAGVPPGTLSGARTPDFSATGRATASQVGSVTGLFPDEAAARRFVALFRVAAFGRCLGAEGGRRWATYFPGGVPAFGAGTLRVPTAAEAAGMGTTARRSGGQSMTIQFFPIRTGPIVTVLSTLWNGGADSRIVATAAAGLGTRQRTA